MSEENLFNLKYSGTVLFLEKKQKLTNLSHVWTLLCNGEEGMRMHERQTSVQF